MRDKRFRYVGAPLLATGFLFIGSGVAWAEEEITLDFVRHGESAFQFEHIMNFNMPGDGLSETGQEQAEAVAQAIEAEYPNGIGGIYASTAIRAQETAAPLADALHMDVQVLAGLHEINTGVLQGIPMNDLTGLLYFAAPIAWIFGQYWVPMLGSSDYNGMAFEDRFDDAVQAIYDNTVADQGAPAVDAVFSHEGSMLAWTLMNVKNPDFALIVQEMSEAGNQLPGAGQIVVHGDPVDGWTLVSWNGTPVPQDPGLPTELFVDFRDLITAPQMAAYHIQEGLLNAIGTESLAPFMTALQEAASDVATATFNFPGAVIQDIVDAVSGSGLSDLTSLFPTAATDVAGFLPGDLGTLIGDAMTAL